PPRRGGHRLLPPPRQPVPAPSPPSDPTTTSRPGTAQRGPARPAGGVRPRMAAIPRTTAGGGTRFRQRHPPPALTGRRARRLSRRIGHQGPLCRELHVTLARDGSRYPVPRAARTVSRNDPRVAITAEGS